jgi:demethylmenaquinone methyltransferase/2-methoxy-6-polyprenyl-1,4-benzoquinol methylase
LGVLSKSLQGCEHRFTRRTIERTETLPEHMHDKPVREQIAYYRARAGEYDEWFLRQGRYDRGPEASAQWFREIEQIQQALDAFRPGGHVLELACGTGLWTQRLLEHAQQITAVDASPEVLALNEHKFGSPRVRYVQADLFDWRPTESYDVVFFSFWLSHVPPERFDAFWDMVAAALSARGRVFFVDSRYEPTSTAVNHQLREKQATCVTRRLNDGRTFEIVKVFYEPEDLRERLTRSGWQAQVAATEHYFLYGQAAR